jgi:cell division protein FtsL
MKKPVMILVTLGIVIVVLSIVQVVVSNRLATTGIQLGQMQTELEQYQQKNTILHEKVLTLSSLDHVASQAATVGYVAAGAPLSIAQPLPIAFHP